MLDFSLEQELHEKGFTSVCGVDEPVAVPCADRLSLRPAFFRTATSPKA